MIKSLIYKNLYKLLNIYSQECKNNCFGSFINIAGYYLLINIDYNRYFDEIQIKKPEEIIDGFYVPNDQDEIILLNNNKLNIIDIIYILPYIYKEQPNYILIEYINTYLKNINDCKNDSNNLDLYLKFYLHYLKIGKMIEDCKDYLDLDNTWYFDYFVSFCKDFNAYTHKVNEDCIESCKIIKMPSNYSVYTHYTGEIFDIKKYQHCGIYKFFKNKM
jgi:hypothetical protein